MFLRNILLQSSGPKSIPNKKPVCCLLHDGFLHGLLVGHDDGGGMFFWNVSRFSPGYIILYSRGQNSTFIWFTRCFQFLHSWILFYCLFHTESISDFLSMNKEFPPVSWAVDRVLNKQWSYYCWKEVMFGQLHCTHVALWAQ
jgi:hypothetical protein